MIGYSEKENIVFTIKKEDTNTPFEPKIETKTIIEKINNLKLIHYHKLKKLIGPVNYFYMRFKYGFKDTYILLCLSNNKIAHIEWIIPAKNIKKRYKFVTNGSYAIIGCVTTPEFRGNGLFPTQIQKVVNSKIPAEKYWIWAGVSNTPSLKGIRRANAQEVGIAKRRKWLFGLFSKAELVSKIQSK